MKRVFLENWKSFYICDTNYIYNAKHHVFNVLVLFKISSKEAKKYFKIFEIV